VSSLSLAVSVWDAINGGGGKPRLKAAKGYFHDIKQEDLPLLCEAYQVWMTFDEYVVIKGVNKKGEKLMVAIKASKRGNDRYRQITRERFSAFDDIPYKRLFEDADIEKGLARTQALFVTLTWPTKFSSIEAAWLTVGQYLNRWRSRLEQKYGRISVARVWQTFANGYPHVHGVLLFRDSSFQVAFKQEETVLHGETKTVYRIAEKEEFEQSWPGFVDVAAVTSTRGALRYCRRYMTRDVTRGESFTAPMYQGGSIQAQDLALQWLYRKRSFGVSGDFREALHDLIEAKRNSKGGQGTLDGDILPDWTWELIGVYSWAQLRAAKEDLDPGGGRPWVVSLSVDDLERLLHHGA